MKNSSEDYTGKNYEDVEKELRAYGFTNVQLIPKKDLIKGIFTKYGQVQEVTVNGKPFRKNARIWSTANIAIEYHVFRNSRKNP